MSRKNTSALDILAAADVATETFEAQANELAVQEAVAAELEAAEKAAADQAAAEAQAKVEAVEAPAVIEEIASVPHVPGDIKVMIAQITPEAREQKAAEVVAEFASRIAFEQSKPGLSSKMVATLESTQKHLSSPGAVNIFCAIDIDPTFVNREIAVGKRFNIYAFGKVNDLLVAIGAGFMKNACNRAVMMSLFNFKEAGVPFNGEHALAAISDKVKTDRAVSKHLVRHTVDAGTAPTQKSSTMNALEIMGIVTSNQLTGKAEIFTLTDTPQTRRLQEVLMAA